MEISCIVLAGIPGKYREARRQAVLNKRVSVLCMLDERSIETHGLKYSMNLYSGSVSTFFFSCFFFLIPPSRVESTGDDGTHKSISLSDNLASMIPWETTSPIRSASVDSWSRKHSV